MAKWIKEFQPKIEQENDTNDKTLQYLERRRSLFKEANKQKYEMESMNDKCEILMEYYSLPEVSTINCQLSIILHKPVYINAITCLLCRAVYV